MKFEFGTTERFLKNYISQHAHRWSTQH